MFYYKNMSDYICNSLLGKVLVKVNDTMVCEKITKAWYDDNINSIVLSNKNSDTFIYNNSFIIVDKLIEIDWDSYRNKQTPKFGFISPYFIESHKNDNYGDLYTIDEFYKQVENGSLIDYDGNGYPSNGTEHVYMGVSVKDLAACKYSKTVSHIIWYNR